MLIEIFGTAETICPDVKVHGRDRQDLPFGQRSGLMENTLFRDDINNGLQSSNFSV